MTYTVQHTQFGVTLTDDFAAEDEARVHYASLCADDETTEAWIFDGPGQDARALEQYIRQAEC